MARRNIKPPVPKPLTGKALLHRLSELEGMNKSEKAKACGYYKPSRTGRKQTQWSAFLNALLDAKGICLDSVKPSQRNRGRNLSYRVQVQKNGMIMIGRGYTQEIGLEPGQLLALQIGEQGIKLIPLEPNSDD